MRQVESPGVSLITSPAAMPGVRVSMRGVKDPILEVALDSGELLIDAQRLLTCAGEVIVAPAPPDHLVCARGTGALTLGGVRTLEGRSHSQGALRRVSRFGIVLAMLQDGQAAYVAPGALMAATPLPSILQLRGAHCRDVLAVQAPAEQAVLLALMARGSVSLQVMGLGEAMDIAPEALLIADGTVDLAAGEHGAAGTSYAFVQCLGPGSVVVHWGGGAW